MRTRLLTFADVADIFRFFSVNDSGTTSATRDVITDFQDWQDTIELQFDANTLIASNNDQFTWIGTDVGSAELPASCAPCRWPTA